MTAAEILVIAKSNDISIDVQGDRLVVDAPIGTLTQELKSELARHKAALVTLLKPATDFVTFRGGLTVALPAVLLALDLERRDCRLSLDAHEEVVIAPRMALTDVDLIAIGRWRLHLAAIVGYDADAHEDVQ